MNNDFLGNYNMTDNDDLVNVNTNIIDEDPINQINMSLDQLLTNLKSDKAITNDNLEAELFNDNYDSKPLDQQILSYQNKNTFMNIKGLYNNLNDYNIIRDEGKKYDDIENNLVIPSKELIEKLSKRQSYKSNDNNNKVNSLNRFRSKDKLIPYRSLSSKKEFKYTDRKIFNTIPNEKIINNNNYNIDILEKIRKIKISNNNNKNDILNFQKNFMKLFQILINSVRQKEAEINKRNQNQINAYKYKINEIMSKNQNSNISSQKMQNIINQNKIQKDEIINKYEKIIKDLEVANNNLMQDKKMYNERFEELKEARVKLNNELILLNKNKDILFQENNKLKERIKQLSGYNNEYGNNDKEQIEKIIIEYESKMKNLKEEINKSQNIINQKNKELEESKKKIDEFQNLMKDVKISLKAHDESQNKINEMDKKLNEYKNVNESLKDENKNIKNEIVKIKSEKIQLAKESNLKKELLEKYKKSISDLNKEKEELKNQIEKNKSEINELKNKNSRILQMSKMKVENSGVNNENIHKLKKNIENLTKEKNALEEKYKELLQRFEIKEKTSKVNRALLSKEKKIIKFENLHRINCISMTIKKRKQKKSINIFNLDNSLLIRNKLAKNKSLNPSKEKNSSFHSSNIKSRLQTEIKKPKKGKSISHYNVRKMKENINNKNNSINNKNNTNNKNNNNNNLIKNINIKKSESKPEINEAIVINKEYLMKMKKD